MIMPLQRALDGAATVCKNSICFVKNFLSFSGSINSLR